MVRINFFGDFVIHDVEKLSVSNDLATVISTADYNCLNFEAPLIGKSGDIVKKSGPSISMDNRAVHFLDKYNFNIISIANNHIMDNGASGLAKTLDKLVDRCVGAGCGQLAYEPRVVAKDGIKIAFLALTHKEFGCVVDDDDVGSAWMCHPKVSSVIQTLKVNVDFLFLIVHAGVEYMDIPIPEIRNLYKSYIDLGADAIIASHPHVPQGYEEYKAKPIFYSLGNFCFQNEAMGYKVNKPFWNNSLSVSFNISSSTSFSYTVSRVYYSQENGLISLDPSKDIEDHVLNCCEILKNKILYNELLSNYLKNLKPYYISMFSGSGWYKCKFDKNFVKGIFGMIFRKKYEPVHLLNAFQCESHRWIVSRMLEANVL